MKIVRSNGITTAELVDVLKNDGVIIFPFDTCYGLVCDPTNQKAVDKLLAYKSRREGKAISVVVDSVEMADHFVEIGTSARNFIGNFLPGPFTIVLKSEHKFAQGIEAENGTVGIRITDFKPIQDLVTAFGSPLTSTSANQSYQKTPYKVEDILETANPKNLELIDLIIDAGELPKNSPSTVLDMSNEDIQVLRKGSIIPDGVKFKERQSNSVEETIELGREIMENFRTNLEFRPIIFALQGDMGAGKTHFTKGIAQSLGIREEIQSPTFIISREYDLQGGNRLYHMDTWRLELKNNFEELEDIEFNKMLEKTSASNFNIISIEWADKIQEYLQKLDLNLKIIWIEIVIDPENENVRTIRWSE
jgi:L-threonylcarbamoyladenylate synthase